MSRPPKRNRIEVPSGVKDLSVSVQGARMRYLTAGSGPPLILVHGLMGFAFSWSENWAGLSPHFTVYAPDLLNAGRSERCDRDGSLETAARSIVHFMDALGLEKASLAGSSHGGTLVMLLFALAPNRIDRVVAISPATSASEQHRWQARFFSSWLGGIAGYCVPYISPIVNGYFVSRMYADPQRILPGTVEGYNAPLRVRGTVPYLLRVMRCWFAEYRALDDKLQGLDQTRLAFLWGDRDRVVPLCYLDDLRGRYPQARSQVMEGVGHLPYEERPEEFNRALIDLLRT